MSNDVFRTDIARTIFANKYRHEGAETWQELSNTLIEDVCQDHLSKEDKQELKRMHGNMEFIAGGRYLYYAGRPNKFFSNCYLLRSEEDSREDWANLSWKAETLLMTGGGIGNDYSRYRPEGAPINKTGGTASGPIPKMQMINEIGRRVMQGGSRRSAIYASLNYRHADADKFLKAKDWHNMTIRGAFDADGNPMTIAKAKEIDFDYPAPLDMTNISLNYDNNFLQSILGDHAYSAWKNKTMPAEMPMNLPPIFIENVRQALKTGEPGFSFNFFDQENETLRNAPVSGDTQIMTDNGYATINSTLGKSVTVWTGKQWVETEFVKTKSNTQTVVIEMSNGRLIKADPEHEFFTEEHLAYTLPDSLEVVKVMIKKPARDLKKGDVLHVSTPSGENETVIVLSNTEGPIEDVYCCDVKVEEHSFMAEGVIISNCTEVVSEDDSDVCNLASVNMSRIDTIERFREVVRMSIQFLLLGTLRADLPYEKVYRIREKNRRLGLGLMGIHEWLIKRGYRYEMNDELRQWMQVYKEESESAATALANRLGISVPVAFRAIAPTGTIGMLASTTTGCEPLFAVAYKRRYLSGKVWKYQYVVDGTAKVLIDQYGVDPESIESAIDLEKDPERRIKFQADLQDYVDMSISSTINLSSWGTKYNNEDTVLPFARTLAKYAHRLRGFTCYPSGARGGQPLTAINYNDALGQEGMEFIEHDICEIGGKGGTCGV